MPQKYKSIYFADHPSETNRAKHVRIAFAVDHHQQYEFARPLTSHELRSVIGHQTYTSLNAAAAASNQSINAYCLQQVTRAYGVHSNDSQHELPFDQVDPPQLQLDPVQATFRGGESEPLHAWYPYLEGYSPSFVTTLLSQFAPQSKRVLDPFSGTGTTPLAVASTVRDGYYCELNPILQYLTEAKIDAHMLAPRTRELAKAELLGFANDLAGRLRSSAPDWRLQQSYTSIFGSSQFFSEETVRKVLRLRSLLDMVSAENPLLGRLATVAALSSLVPASDLIRRGDLRFKTKDEMNRPSPSLEEAMNFRLHQIANDLDKVGPFTQRPKFLCADARKLRNLPPLEVDAVITSPPYLNGTNYFRNTKVELWFSRCVQTGEDLSRFRAQAVTCGINDVTVAKATSTGITSVDSVVRNLNGRAYDPRIPRMVQTYFHDMNCIFENLVRHVQPHSPVLVDIGDSAYGGIHVDTPLLLTEIAAIHGFDLEKEVILRRRMSRGGLPLRQVLLQLRLKRKHVVQRAQEIATWAQRWRTFKRQLPHQTGDFAKRNWGHPLHSLCSYQGKMKPSLAHHLVRTFVPNMGGALLDPFGGVGTIPFEAALLGVRSWCFDISPPAVHIAGAKLQPASSNACLAEIEKLSRAIDRYKLTKEVLLDTSKFGFNGALIDYIPQSWCFRVFYTCSMAIDRMHLADAPIQSLRSHPPAPPCIASSHSLL